jgi:hypothetical protein
VNQTGVRLQGNAPAAIQARAGHADFSTTQLYTDLAGVAFCEEAEQAEARVFSDLGGEANLAPVAYPLLVKPSSPNENGCVGGRLSERRLL